MRIHPASALKRLARLAAVASLWPFAGCAVLNHGMLASGVPVMAQQRHLFIIVSLVMLFVIGLVQLLASIFAWHYRLSNTKSAHRPEWSFNWPLEFFIWIPPTMIVIGLAWCSGPTRKRWIPTSRWRRPSPP